jgi:hypothetical protein
MASPRDGRGAAEVVVSLQERHQRVALEPLGRDHLQQLAALALVDAAPPALVDETHEVHGSGEQQRKEPPGVQLVR